MDHWANERPFLGIQGELTSVFSAVAEAKDGGRGNVWEASSSAGFHSDKSKTCLQARAGLSGQGPRYTGGGHGLGSYQPSPPRSGPIPAFITSVRSGGFLFLVAKRKWPVQRDKTYSLLRTNGPVSHLICLLALLKQALSIVPGSPGFYQSLCQVCKCTKHPLPNTFPLLFLSTFLPLSSPSLPLSPTSCP